MKKVIWIYGLIIGVIISVHTIIMMNMTVNNKNFSSNDILGYAAIIAMFSLIFFGIRKYRNSYNNGYITLGKAFKIGAAIALIGSTMYVIFGLGYYYLFLPEYLDANIQHVLQNCTSPEELAIKSKEMAEFKEAYKNPLFAILISYMEVLPLGLVVAFVSSLILKNKVPLQS
ncbi:MAG: DUF4199 domain-containing protein [Chitinophagaceae bacterium]|nr:DUF4199 domain-containing protein [Chitinophagaceae bacterium]